MCVCVLVCVCVRVCVCVCVCFSVSDICVASCIHSKRGSLFCRKVGNVVQGNETTNTFLSLSI